MSSKLSAHIRNQVKKRAGHRCEYCRIHENDSFLPFGIDHIISLKHGGGNELSNLACCCPHCNQYKGTDLTTFLDSYYDIVTIFNPRLHLWDEHFSVEYGAIRPLSRIAEATIKLLRLNESERIVQRQALMETGDYPF